MATEELKTNVELDTNVKKVQIQRYEPEDFPETHYLNEEKGLRAWLTTVDHKKIGLMYLGSTTFFFFVGGILAIILRTELFTPTRSFIDADVYNQLFTLHGAIMVFLFLVPVVPAALGNFILPLQLGAKDVAFPKLNLVSYYIYVIGAVITLSAILGGGIDTGWTFYTPYSTSTSGGNIFLMTFGVFVLGFSSILTGLNFIVSIHKLRAPGMTWDKLPLFLWSLYATSIIQILATPVLAITLLLLGMERLDRKSTRLNSSHVAISYAVFCSAPHLAPLSFPTRRSSDLVLGFSSILTGLNFIVSIHKLRAPGMTWDKLPLFLWSLYATSIIQILATPVLAITLLLLGMERLLGIGIFDPSMGGDPVLYQHFFWFYSHPAVYIMIVPGFGIISEIVSAFSRKIIFGYWAIALSSLAIAFIGFFVWGHHMFTSGQSSLANMIFSFLTFLVGIPTGIKVFNWVATLYKGSIQLKTPMLYALTFLFLFMIGGFTGIMVGTLSVNIHVHDTYYVVAHFHYVMMGGMVFALLGGLHYWWPKFFGTLYSEILAKIACGLMFIGFNMTFLPQFIMGSQGMPRRYFNYIEQFQPFHQLSTIGAYIMLIAFLMMAGYFLHSILRGKKSVTNPWQSRAMEWQTTTPPPMHHFHHTPVIINGPYDYHKPMSEFQLGIAPPGDGHPIGASVDETGKEKA